MKRVCVLALILAIFACHDDNKMVAPTGPGVLDVLLTTPNADDGAILLTVDGAVDSVQGAPYVIFSATSASGARIVVTGDVVGGVIAKLYVPDVGTADQYLAHLDEVAQRGTFALQPLTSYQLELRVEQ